MLMKDINVKKVPEKNQGLQILLVAFSRKYTFRQPGCHSKNALDPWLCVPNFR